MTCKNCKKEMLLDDVDFNFKGNKDNYYICENCHTSCIEKIRYNKQVNVEWNEEEMEGK